MLNGSNHSQRQESPIFDDLTIYKIIKTKQGRHIILHFDGSVSAIIPFEGINNTSFSEDDYIEKFTHVQKTLDEINDTNVTLQFVMVRDNNVGDIDVKKLPSYLRPRAEYLLGLAENYQLFVNKFYIGVHYANKRDIAKSKGLIDTVKALIKKEEDAAEDAFKKSMSGLNQRVQVLSEVVDAVTKMIVDMGAEFKMLNSSQEYIDVIQTFTRPYKSKENKLIVDQDKESVRRTLFSGGRSTVRRKDFTLDDVYHKVFTLDRAPQEYLFGKTIEAIENVPYEFIYSVCFRVMDHKESINVFKFRMAEKRIQEGSNEGAIVEDRSLTADTQRMSENYDEFAYGNAKGISVSANFVLRVQEMFIDKLVRKTETSREELLRKIDQNLTKQVFSKFGLSEWVNEENTGWPVFCQVIPGMANIHKGILKEMFLSTSNIPYFFALYDNKRKLEHNGTNHFVDMRGNKVVFDLMDPGLPAWNYSISGQTGSGKSVLMNAILTMQLSDVVTSGQLPIICILDVGGDRGSYAKFMKLVNGLEINLSGAVKPSIQMFEIVPERSFPTPAKYEEIVSGILVDNPDRENEELELKVRAYFAEFIQRGGNNLNQYERETLFEETLGVKFLSNYKRLLELSAGTCEPSQRNFNLIMAILEVILSSSVKDIDGFRNFDYDEVSKIVLETYRRTPGRYPFMTDFYNVAKEMVTDDESKKISEKGSKLLIKVQNWTRKGAYPMFDQPSDIKIMERDVVLADMKGLENEPQLQVIYTLLISQLFNDKMYFIKNRRKVMVRDEAWSLMKNDRARQYFIEDLRTARKNGFATIAISQLPTDYNQPDPAAGKAIISNMQVQIFCKFSTQSICEEVGREFSLPPEIVEEMKGLGLVKTLQPDGSYKPEYSKFMMVMEVDNKKSIYILKNLLHPFEYILYSSSAEDNAVIDYYMKEAKQISTLEDVLWYISEKRHIGDTGLAAFLEKGGFRNKVREVLGDKKK